MEEVPNVAEDAARGPVNWNYLEARADKDRRLVVPVIGPGDLARADAVSVIQQHLDTRARQTGPAGDAYTQVAALWRHGAKDDTVFLGPFTWAVYPHEPGRARPAAEEWLRIFATVLRANGMDMTVGPLD